MSEVLRLELCEYIIKTNKQKQSVFTQGNLLSSSVGLVTYMAASYRMLLPRIV